MTNLFQELPVGWEWLSLEEVAEVNPRFKEKDLPDEMEVSFVPMRCVEEQTGRIDLSEVRELGKVRRGYTYFAEGDVLFAKITPCMENGKAAVAHDLTNGLGFGSTEFHVVRPSPAILGRFIFYYLIQEGFRKEAQRKMTGSAGQKRVPTVFMKGADVPVPPLAEQHRIVAKIEELFTQLDAGIEALKTAKKQLKRYRQSVLKAAVEGKLTAAWREQHGHEVEPTSHLLERILQERRAKWEAEQLAKFEAKGKKPPKDWPQRYTLPLHPDSGSIKDLPDGWTLATVDQLCTDVTSGSRGWAKYYADEGAFFIRAQDIKTDSLELEGVARVSLPANVEGTRTLVDRWNLLITITGANVTKAAIVDRDLGEAYVNQHIALLRPVRDEVASYLFLWITSPAHGRAKLLEDSYGAGKPGLNLNNIKEITLALPPVAEQRVIVEEVERLFSVADDVERTIISEHRRAERLRQSILKRAFEGKLVPQDPTDEPASALLERIREGEPSGKTKSGKGKAEKTATGELVGEQLSLNL